MGSQKLVLSIALTLSSMAFGEMVDRQIFLRKFDLKDSVSKSTPITDQSVQTLRIYGLSLDKEKASGRFELGEFEVGKKKISCSATEQSAGGASSSASAKKRTEVKLAQRYGGGNIVGLDVTLAGKESSERLSLTCTSRKMAQGIGESEFMVLEDLQKYFDTYFAAKLDKLLQSMEKRHELKGESISYIPDSRRIARVKSAVAALLDEETRQRSCVDMYKPAKVTDEVLQRCTADEAPRLDVLQGSAAGR